LSDTDETDRGPLSHAAPRSESARPGRVDPGPPTTLERDRRPRPGSATATVVVGFVGLIASLVVLGAIAEGVRAKEAFVLDTWATPFLHGIASPGLDALMGVLTAIGSDVVIAPVLIIVVARLFWTRVYRSALFLVVATTGALVLNGTMKLIFTRPRPQLDWARVLPDYSFLSGHTMNSFVFYVALALVLWSAFGRRIGVVALITAVALAFGVGVRRIYLGYHYLTDVFAGFLAGIGWLLVVGAAFRARPIWHDWRGSGVQRTHRPGSPDAPPVG
jgi:undecaprenyl-diphosphatase